MREIFDRLLRRSIEHPRQLGLKRAVDLETAFVDSTCLKANIHFPTDWVLLRDAVRTLMKATILIRREGLRGRMAAPEAFLRAMNRLSIEMSQQARRAGRKKGRKRVLREMKRLVRVVRAHARRHRELLDREWERSSWTRTQAEVILRRLDDRAFASAINHRTLAETGTYDALCPRNPQRLRQRMKEERFAHRELELAWGVLTHNLWMLARLCKRPKKAIPLQQAA